MQMPAKRRKVKIIPLVAVASVTLTVLALVFALVVTSRTANDIARNNTATMIAGGLQAEFDKLEAAAHDFAVWKPVYNPATQRDIEWLDENIGGRSNQGLFDALQIYWPEDGASIGWFAQTGLVNQPNAIPADLIDEALAQIAQQPDHAHEIFSSLAIVDGNIALVAASRIEPTELGQDVIRENLPVTFMVNTLSSANVMALGESYLIDDLSITDDAGAAQSLVPITGFDGATIGNFAWTPPAPGANLVRALLPMMAGSVAIIIIFSWFVGRLAQKIADKLRASVAASAKQARTDVLTDLPNRLAFQEEMAKVVEQSTQEVALIAADINSFKMVNDTLGHAAGDTLIRGIADRIGQTMNQEVFFSRIGGDEFCLMLAGPSAAERLTGAAQSIRSALEPAFYLEGSPFFLSMSMGLAVRQADETISQDELLRRADIAMYTSKSSASNMLIRYDAEIDPSRVEELELETELRNALKHPEQFSVTYQPIVTSSNSNIDLAEALVRWQSPTLGAVSPADFIPVAEASGLIRHITSMVLEMVCQDLANSKTMKVSINISPVEISDPNFHDDLAHSVRRHGVAPEQIVIELTEGVLVENPRGLAASLQRLRLMGHQIALDDFGTGYSSIGYLRQMEFTILKIDKSLVDGVTTNKRARDVLSATLDLAKAIGIRVLAEGVETQEQAKLLKEMGFDFQQGFNFSAGLNFDDLLDFASKQGKITVAA